MTSLTAQQKEAITREAWGLFPGRNNHDAMKRLEYAAMRAREVTQ